MADTASETDVLVIGGGIAGMVAANRAGELGKRVLVLERGEETLYPCNARWSGGTFHVHFTDPMASEEELRAAIRRATEGFTDTALGEALAADCGRLVRWLKREGIRMVNLGGYHTSVLAPPAGTAPGLAWKGQGGDVALQRLEANLNQRNGSLLRGVRATEIAPDGDGMRVWAMSADGPVSYTAGDVIIADGGFPADLELVAKHITPKADKLLQRNAGSATGDGLRMAQSLGAALTDGLDCFYGHLLCRDALTNDRLWPRPYLDSLVTAGLVVDRSGRRFAYEGNGGVYMANEVARLDDPLSAFVVFDHAIWTGPGAKSLVAANPHLVNGGGTLHRADSLEGLAALMEVSPEGLVETVADHNGALDGSQLEALSPPRRSDRHAPWPIAAAPFYAIPLCSGITHVMGGIRIDANGKVLREDGGTIGHLYAAGACTGGIEGGPAIGYVGGLSKSGVMGLRAAEHIARGRPGEDQSPVEQTAKSVQDSHENPAPTYPMLKRVVRYGNPASAVVALAVLAIGIAAAVAAKSMLMALAGTMAAGIVYFLARILVELVRLIMDMLVPQ